MLKNNKLRMIISSLIILLPLFAGLIFFDKIDLPAAKSILIMLPIFLLVMHIVCLLFTAHDNSRNDQNKKALRMIFWIIPIISLCLSGIMYGIISESKSNVFTFMPIMFGILFILIGNYMPKTKQNRTLGIKISWTLGNEENWSRTHRLAGKVWFFGGILLLFTALLPETFIIPVVLCVTIAAVVIPIIYSYRIYRQHRKQGIEYAAVERSKVEKYAVRITIIIVAVLSIFIGVLMFTGDITINCGDTSLTVNADYWSDIELDYSEIESLEYRTDLDAGIRTYGFASGRLMLGYFKNDEFSTYTRYTYTGLNACIVIKTKDSVIVIGAKDSDVTNEIYKTLLDKTNKATSN